MTVRSALFRTKSIEASIDDAEQPESPLRRVLGRWIWWSSASE
jgi:hypothetical protein